MHQLMPVLAKQDYICNGLMRQLRMKLRNFHPLGIPLNRDRIWDGLNQPKSIQMKRKLIYIF